MCIKYQLSCTAIVTRLYSTRYVLAWAASKGDAIIAHNPGRLTHLMAATMKRPDELPKNHSMYNYPQRRPAEVEAESGALEEYDKWRQSTDLREPYRIPIDFLKGTKPFAGLNMAEVPLLCFINSKSGGQAGPTVTLRLSQAISYSQVFDVSQHRPDRVLHAVYDNLRAGIQAKDPGARHIAKYARGVVYKSSAVYHDK